MIMDKIAEMCDATSLNAVSPTDTLVVGTLIDTGAAPTLKNMGTGEPLYWVISVDTAVAGVSGTTTLYLISDSTTTLAAPGTATTHITSPTFTTAQLVKGFTWCAPLPVTDTYERYLGTWQIQATATVTAGKINSFITNHPPSQYTIPLPDAIA